MSPTWSDYACIKADRQSRHANFRSLADYTSEGQIGAWIALVLAPKIDPMIGSCIELKRAHRHRQRPVTPSDLPSVGTPGQSPYSDRLPRLLPAGHSEEPPSGPRAGSHAEGRIGETRHHSDVGCVLPNGRRALVADAPLHPAGAGPTTALAPAEALFAPATTSSAQCPLDRIGERRPLFVVKTFSMPPLKVKDLTLRARPYCESWARRLAGILRLRPAQ